MRATGACVGFVAAAVLCMHHGFALAQPTPSLADQPDSSSALSISAASPPFPIVFVGARLGLGELHFQLGRSNTWGRSYPIQAWTGVALTHQLVLLFEFYDTRIFNPSSTYAELTVFNLVGFGPGLWRLPGAGPMRPSRDGDAHSHCQPASHCSPT